MCYYRLYIFLGCGHATFSSTPVRHCTNATSPINNRALEDLSSIQPTTNLKTPSTSVALNLDVESQPDATAELQVSSSTKLPSQEANHTKDLRKYIVVNPVNASEPKPCREGQAHPLHTVRLERICAGCAFEREERLRALESFSTEIKFEPNRWQWKYRGNSETLPPKMPIMEGNGNSTIVSVGADLGVVEQRKVDSGVWTMGAKMNGFLKDWKGQG
jgi:hypothetical protein